MDSRYDLERLEIAMLAPSPRERLLMAYMSVNHLAGDLPPDVLEASNQLLAAAPPALLAELVAMVQQASRDNLPTQARALTQWLTEGRRARWN